MKLICFNNKAFQEYQQWVERDKRLAIRIGDLIKDILRDPFRGIGKPEALKGDFQGYWSRRINNEHRIVYTVTNEYIIGISYRSHYKM